MLPRLLGRAATAADLDDYHARLQTMVHRAVFDLLLPVPGLNRYTIEVVIAETGADMDRFPSAAQLAAWAGLCPATMSRPANAAGSALLGARHRATSGCGAPGSRRPAPRPGPRAAPSPPNTARSPVGVVPTRPRSRSPIACSTSAGTCCVPGSATSTWATTSSSADGIQRARPAAWFTSSNRSATRSPSPALPRSHASTTPVGRRPTAATCPKTHPRSPHFTPVELSPAGTPRGRENGPGCPPTPVCS